MSKVYVSKEKNFISAVVYLDNKNNALSFLKKIDTVLNENFEAYEFVIVNDRYQDDELKELKAYGDKIRGNFSIVNLAWEHGLESSMIAGIDLSIGDFVLEFDTTAVDYEEQLVLDVYYKSLEGYDIVSATPRGNLKKSSKMFYSFLNKVSYRKMDLRTERFRVVSRRAINRVYNIEEKVPYRKALYHCSGFKLALLSYDANQDKVEDTLSLKSKIGLASDILIGFSDIGFKITSRIALFFVCISIFMAIYTVYQYFTLENVQLGWTTTMLFLSVSFSGIFVILSIMANYLTFIIKAISNRPSYVFKSIEKISRK